MYGFKKFKYVFAMDPIDFWTGATIAEPEMEEAVIIQMPEEPRNGNVYKLLLPIPGECNLVPVYLCKADNNGTTYVFADYDLKKVYEKYLW